MLDGLQEVLSNDAWRNEQRSWTQVCWTEQREEGYHLIPGRVDTYHYSYSYHFCSMKLNRAGAGVYPEYCLGTDIASEGGEEVAEVQGLEHAQAWQEALHPH